MNHQHIAHRINRRRALAPLSESAILLTVALLSCVLVALLSGGLFAAILNSSVPVAQEVTPDLGPHVRTECINKVRVGDDWYLLKCRINRGE